MLIPVLYAVDRWAWALGVPLGVTKEFLAEEARDTPDICFAGAMLATLAAGGSVLTFGLIRRWGEVYPRWIPYLRGKPVRPRTAIIPAVVVAVLVTTAGLQFVRHAITLLADGGGLGANWGTVVPATLWPFWGISLAAAALAHYLRRRGECPRCERG